MFLEVTIRGDSHTTSRFRTWHGWQHRYVCRHGWPGRMNPAMEYTRLEGQPPAASEKGDGIASAAPEDGPLITQELVPSRGGSTFFHSLVNGVNVLAGPSAPPHTSNPLPRVPGTLKGAQFAEHSDAPSCLSAPDPLLAKKPTQGKTCSVESSPLSRSLAASTRPYLPWCGAGIGILSTPFATAGAGWLGLILLGFFAFACCYTGLLLRACMDIRPGIDSYPDVGMLQHLFKQAQTASCLWIHPSGP